MFGNLLFFELQGLTSLTLHSSFVSDCVAEGAVHALPRLRQLQTLVLTPGLVNPYVIHPRTNADLIRAIGRCWNLRNVNLLLNRYRKSLTRGRSSWHNACFIGRLKSLEILRVDDGSKHSGYLRFLQRFVESPSSKFAPLVMEKLRELSICSLHGAQGAKPLAGVLKALPGLQTLSLRGSVLGHDGVVHLAPAFSHLPLLKHLDLSSCRVDCLSHRRKQHLLWLEPKSRQGREAAGGSFFADSESSGAPLVDEEGNVLGISVLDRGDGDFADVYHYDGPLSVPGRALASGLLNLQELEVLVLRDEDIRVDSALAVARVLGRLQKLRKLDLHGWLHSDEADDPRGAVALAGSLRQLSGLEQLDLSSTDLTCAGLAAVMPAVAQHANLTELDLSSTELHGGVQAQGFQTVCDHLGSLVCMQKLTLMCAESEGLDLNALARALQPLTHINDLTLRMNWVYDSLLLQSLPTEFFEVVKSMANMQQLTLNGIDFMEGRVDSLIDALVCLSRLERLSLERCYMACSAVAEVVAAVQSHAGLRECVIPAICMGPGGVCECSEAGRPAWVVVGSHGRVPIL